MPEILKVDPKNPDQSIINAAVRILREGGILAYPTETFYGLGADGFNDKAIEKIFLMKGRHSRSPVPVIIGEMRILGSLVREVSEDGTCLMNAFWPGALTLVFAASPNIQPRLTAGTGKIGIRISSNPIATALAKTHGHPVTSTSANLSGARECTSAEEVITCVGERIDAVIDGGTTPGGSGSTVVDITVHPPVILREGVIPGSLIFHTLKNR